MPYNRRKYATTAASKKAIATANITTQTIFFVSFIYLSDRAGVLTSDRAGLQTVRAN